MKKGFSISKNKVLYYLSYTLIFLLLSGTILFFFYSQGRTMIDYGGDGFRQHYRALLYYSRYVRNIIINLFQSGKLVIPQFDFSIGEGSDILATFHYYGMGDIFTLLSFLCPEKYLYLYYDLSTVFRMYCSGIVFSWLCLYKKKTNYSIILAASLLYAFGSFNLGNMYGHVFFISAAVFLPAIILGIEKILNNDRPFFLMIVVMLSSMSNIYFFYMNVISTVFFVAVRILLMKISWKVRLDYLIKISIYSFYGLLMSMIIFLPVAYSMLASSRFDTQILYDSLYEPSYYLGMYTNLSFCGYMFFGGYSLLGVMALVKLFVKDRNRTLITLFLLGLLFACIPFFGAMYNAFTYPICRWLYALMLLVNYIIVNEYDESDYDISISFTVIIVLFYLSCIVLDKEKWQIHVLFLTAFAFVVVISKFLKNRKYISYILLLITIGSLMLDVLYQFSPSFWAYSDTGTPISLINSIDEEEHSAFDFIDDDSFYRYSGDYMTTNTSILGDHSSTQYYWSIANDNIIEFRKLLGLSDHNNHHFDHYDDRFGLNSLASVKYYFENDYGIIPYGFSYTYNINGYNIYRSNFVLPMIYGYDSYITKNEFENLDLVKRNEVLLQDVVLDKEIDTISKNNPIFEAKELDYDFETSDGLTVTDNEIVVETGNSVLSLNSNYLGLGEYYLIVEGLYSDVSCNIVVGYDGVDKILYYKGPYHTAYPDKHDFMICLGTLDELSEPVTMRFTNSGNFTYTKIKLIYQPLRSEVSNIEDLNNVYYTDLLAEDNRVSFKVDNEKDKVICISIPYSNGWKAYVDGKKADLLKCNIQYMGLALEQGNHEIELRYETPLLKIGAVISLASWIGFGLLWSKKRNYYKI